MGWEDWDVRSKLMPGGDDDARGCPYARRSPDGVLRRCRKMTCEFCAFLRVEWLKGRVAAECFQADWVRHVTLTYSDEKLPGFSMDDYRGFHRLTSRRHEYKSVTVLEYGEKTGRPHFHTLMAGRGPMPDIELDVRAMLPGWTKGFSYWQSVGDGGDVARNVTYVLKYILPDASGHFCGMSPKMGAGYLLGLAEQRAAHRERLTSNDHRIRFTVPGWRSVKRNKKQGPVKKAFIDAGPKKFIVPSGEEIAKLMAERYNATWGKLHSDFPSDPLLFLNWDAGALDE